MVTGVNIILCQTTEKKKAKKKMLKDVKSTKNTMETKTGYFQSYDTLPGERELSFLSVGLQETGHFH